MQDETPKLITTVVYAVSNMQHESILPHIQGAL